MRMPGEGLEEGVLPGERGGPQGVLGKDGDAVLPSGRRIEDREERTGMLSIPGAGWGC